jgi:hypothetical protein
MIYSIESGDGEIHHRRFLLNIPITAIIIYNKSQKQGRIFLSNFAKIFRKLFIYGFFRGFS